MTAGNNGESTPEDDDPFGYLYADGQASGATPPPGSGGYGYPGPRNPTSPVRAHQVRTVGERQYGQQPPGARGGGYGYPPAGQVPQQGYQQQGGRGYHQPNAHYQAPETLPGGPGATRHGPPGRGHGAPGRGGPNTKGLLIGAIAVVAAVVIGIGAAMLTGGDGSKDDATDPSSAPTAGTSVQPSQTSPDDQPTEAEDLPKTDAKALRLDGGTVTASDIKGARAGGGVYVAGFNKPGASVTWTVSGITDPGKYTLYIGYGVPGKDASATLTVNGKPETSPLSLKNWSNAAAGDWEKGWTRSYTFIELNKGTNTIQLSCGPGNQCDVNFDQVWLKKGWKQ